MKVLRGLLVWLVLMGVVAVAAAAAEFAGLGRETCGRIRHFIPAIAEGLPCAVYYWVALTVPTLAFVLYRAVTGTWTRPEDIQARRERERERKERRRKGLRRRKTVLFEYKRDG